MKVQAIVHQQICQLRWHLLACVGLIMVLPLEEGAVSFRAGDGFRSLGLALVAVSFSPLLAGLIACANVQGDLSEKRYIFWRSKPANVKKLMALKYVVGLAVSLAILACPLVFAVVSTWLCGEDLDAYLFKYYVPMVVLIAVMTYSLCFVCNVLVRSTARAWLIGMLMAGFVLVFPFMLPLGFTDIVTDVGMWTFGCYPAIIVVVSMAAFVCALYAAQHDWHLRTNLKGLLCVAAGLVLILLMLFSSQVANIRVLDEKMAGLFGTFDKVGSRIIFGGMDYVNVDRKGFSLERIGSKATLGPNYPVYSNIGIDSEGNRVTYGPRVKGYHVRTYPEPPNALYMATEEGIYHFGMVSYHRREGEIRRQTNTFEMVYLRSYKLIGDSWTVVSELDISDFLTHRKNYIWMTMRLFDKTLVACVNRSFATVDVTRPNELKVIDKKLDVIPLPSGWLWDEERRKEFYVPLLPIEGIDTEDRIRLSIDLAYRYYHGDDHFYDSSTVDVQDGKIAFFGRSDRGITRFDVTRWDDEKVYCKFSTARPFTILETMLRPFGGRDDRVFVQDRKLYLAVGSQLMVFDVRSDSRIRKVGHFARMDCRIEDVAVLEDGRLLLCTWSHAGPGGRNASEEQRHLYLLENPK